jgi:hypothetical protein
MHRAGFSFTSPLYRPDDLGNVYMWAPDGESDVDGVRSTFRQMWDTAYTAQSSVTADFWAEDIPSYMLEAITSQQHARVQYLQLNFRGESLPGPNDDQPFDEGSRDRLRRWLDCVRELSRLSAPAYGTLDWEETGDAYVVGTISPPNATEPVIDTHLPFAPPNVSVVKEVLHESAIMSRLDPFPIPLGANWLWVDLS